MKRLLTSALLTFSFSFGFSQSVSTIGQTAGSPSGITLDAAGFVYVAQRTAPSSSIVKMNQTTGIATTFSNTGIVDPMDIQFGPNNQLFVADYGAGSIVKIPSMGGTASAYVTGATQPTGLAFDSDTLYYIEYSSQLIFKVLPGGGAVGSGNVIQISDSAFWMGPNPRGVGLTLLTNGNLFVTAGLHYYQYIVNKATGTIISDVGGDDHTVFGAEQLSDGNLYMPGNNTNKIYKWIYGVSDSAPFIGNGSAESADGSDTLAAFDSPYFMASDASDFLYVSDYNSKKIRKISTAPVGLKELTEEFISVYPNPASSVISIELKDIGAIAVLSAEGKVLDRYSNSSSYQIDLNIYENGIYFVQAENGITQRFIKN